MTDEWIEYFKCLLCMWHKPTENWDISGICFRISSVTKCTPLCCGLRLILRWNHAEPIWIPRLDDAIPKYLSSRQKLYSVGKI